MSRCFSLQFTCFESVGIAVEEVEQHEPSEVDWIPQQASYQPPHLWRGETQRIGRRKKAHDTPRQSAVYTPLLSPLIYHRLTSNLVNMSSGTMTRVIGSRRPSRVVRGTRKNAKNHHRVIFGMLDIQLEISPSILSWRIKTKASFAGVGFI